MHVSTEIDVLVSSSIGITTQISHTHPIAMLLRQTLPLVGFAISIVMHRLAYIRVWMAWSVIMMDDDVLMVISMQMVCQHVVYVNNPLLVDDED